VDLIATAAGRGYLPLRLSWIVASTKVFLAG
jgi:hypothetical protein